MVSKKRLAKKEEKQKKQDQIISNVSNRVDEIIKSSIEKNITDKPVETTPINPYGGYAPSINPEKNVVSGNLTINGVPVSKEEYENYLINARNEANLGRNILTPGEKAIQDQQLQNVLGNVGNVPQINEARLRALQAEVSPESQRKEGRAGALREAIPNALFQAGTAAAGGAVLGAPTGVGAPILATAGAVLGFVRGFYKSFEGQRKAEASEDVRNAMAEFTQLKKGMAQVATLTTSGQIAPEEATQMFNAQYYRMLELQAQLKYLQDTNLKDYLSGGGTDYISITSYLDSVVPAYQSRIQTAILNPNTSTIPYSDILTEEESI